MLTNSSGLYHDLQQEMNSSIDVSKTSQSQSAVNLLTLCGLYMYMHVFVCVYVWERERAQERQMILCMSVPLTLLENEIPLYLTWKAVA